MTESLNNLSLRLHVHDIVSHPAHGEGKVVKISQHPEYPVEVVFEHSPVVTRIKVPISLYFSLFGTDVVDRNTPTTRLTRISAYA